VFGGSVRLGVFVWGFGVLVSVRGRCSFGGLGVVIVVGVCACVCVCVGVGGVVLCRCVCVCVCDLLVFL